MRPEMTEAINLFVDTMIESRQMFEDIRIQIDKKDAAVTDCIHSFREGVSKLLSNGLDSGDEELAKLYEKATKSLQLLLSDVAEDMKRTQKGTEFIHKYEQSLNVAVFGKVKAGKSYLGNFIMGNEIRNMGIETSYDKLPRPTVEVHDRGKTSVQERMAEMTEEGQEGFGVAANEATSAIQLFRLGGLTWFDTPGIGSVTWDNELLAKEYVDNADLVIFACNSDAAGTRQDFAEMKTLHEKGKPFLLLLTQSDTLEEDFDDETGEVVNALVAKSPKDRTDTEQYMMGELRANGIELREGELLTISAKLAMTALEKDDAELFRDSHMHEFLHVLTDITKAEGAQLKRKTPGDRINATIADLMKRLDEAADKLKESRELLREKQRNLSTKGELLLIQMQQDCLNRVDTIIRQKAAEVEKGGSVITADELGKILGKEIQGVLLRVCASEFSSGVDAVLSDYTVRMDGMSDLKVKKDVIPYTVHVVRRIERDPHGLLERAGAFLFDKSYYKSVSETETRTHEIELGVNEQQVISIAHGQLENLFRTEVPGLMKKISERYLAQISKLLDASTGQIRVTRQELEKLKC